MFLIKGKVNVFDYFLLGTMTKSLHLHYGAFSKSVLWDTLSAIMAKNLPRNRKSEQHFRRVFDNLIETTENKHVSIIEQPEMFIKNELMVENVVMSKSNPRAKKLWCAFSSHRIQSNVLYGSLANGRRFRWHPR